MTYPHEVELLFNIMQINTTYKKKKPPLLIKRTRHSTFLDFLNIYEQLTLQDKFAFSIIPTISISAIKHGSNSPGP